MDLTRNYGAYPLVENVLSYTALFLSFSAVEFCESAVATLYVIPRR